MKIPNTETCFLRSISNRCGLKAKISKKNVTHDDPPQHKLRYVAKLAMLMLMQWV